MKDLMKVADVAEMLELSTDRVYQLIRSGHIPSVRVGGSIRIPKPAWDVWLARQSASALETLQDTDERLPAGAPA